MKQLTINVNPQMVTSTLKISKYELYQMLWPWQLKWIKGLKMVLEQSLPQLRVQTHPADDFNLYLMWKKIHMCICITPFPNDSTQSPWEEVNKVSASFQLLFVFMLFSDSRLCLKLILVDTQTLGFSQQRQQGMLRPSLPFNTVLLKR